VNSQERLRDALAPYDRNGDQSHVPQTSTNASAGRASYVPNSMGLANTFVLANVSPDLAPNLEVMLKGSLVLLQSQTRPMTRRPPGETPSRTLIAQYGAAC
jgi:hypothetical protein